MTMRSRNTPSKPKADKKKEKNARSKDVDKVLQITRYAAMAFAVLLLFGAYKYFFATDPLADATISPQKLKDMMGYVESEARSKSAATSGPKEKELESLIAKAKRFAGRRAFDKAVEYHKQIVEMDPENWKEWYNYGKTLQNMEKYKEAEEKYQMVIKLNPEYTGTYVNLAICLGQQGSHRHKEARTVLLKALDLAKKKNETDAKEAERVQKHYKENEDDDDDDDDE